MNEIINVAYFITSHGFGHASRSVAVMSAMIQIEPRLHFEIFTNTPAWFFEDSISDHFSLHPATTDIGIIQKSPLLEDIPETIVQLNKFLPFNHELVTRLSSMILEQKCKFVINDISPLGIAVAHHAGIPSVLIENFTWDWIYQNYLLEYPEFEFPINYLKDVYKSTKLHIQTQPFCQKHDDCVLVSMPVSRQPIKKPSILRNELSVPESSKMVLITMGGIPAQFNFLSLLTNNHDIHYVIPGGAKTVQHNKKMVLIPHHSKFHHPDLIQASDAIIGKAGYSTIAEVYHAGIPFGYVTRSNFRESASLSNFIQSEMYGIEIQDTHFSSGDWIDIIPDIINMPRISRNEVNGAIQIAEALCDRLLW